MGTIAAVRARVGKRGFSAYVDAAVQRQVECDNLAELTAEHGASSRAENDAVTPHWPGLPTTPPPHTARHPFGWGFAAQPQRASPRLKRK
ncbi:hypothetical protein NKH18_26890 [Streptomyces sp. M10(2022)]